MLWNRETRYTPYNQWPEATLPQLVAQVRQSKWRMQHHIQPDSGLLNDPNGFSYFNGQWHLFYQVFPFGPVHGLKSWQHMTSDNLIDWHDEGLAIQPGDHYDSHGAYTGTALPVNNQLFMMYTGNVRTVDWQRESYQLGAWMTADNGVTKIETPLIMAEPEGYTSSFRDPYLIKDDTGYTAIIGGQTTQEVGAMLLYHSTDLVDWQFQGELNIPQADRGYMIECPNLIWVDHQPVMIFCPQGLSTATMEYQNIYPDTYVVSQSVDLVQGQVTEPGELTQLDEGFDVYASEAINAPDGRALAVSWIGLPELTYPTDQEGWAHCLSLVKELTLKDGHLYQNPVAETEQLRTTAYAITTAATGAAKVTNLNGSFEVLLTVPADQQATIKISNADQTGDLIFRMDAQTGQVLIDRSQTGHPFAEQYGQTRVTQLAAHTTIKIRLVIDVSVFECYINNGYTVMTGRFFLDDTPSRVQVDNQTGTSDGKVWNWRK